MNKAWSQRKCVRARRTRLARQGARMAHASVAATTAFVMTLEALEGVLSAAGDGRDVKPALRDLLFCMEGLSAALTGLAVVAPRGPAAGDDQPTAA